MSNKQTRIIETAMKLFSQKGYHSTSIQEIAENSGIAKGSIYNYFSSKEDLFMSIFKHYHERLFNKVSEIEQNETLSDRDMFAEQLYIQFQQFLSQKDFIHMQMRQQIIQVNDEIRNYMFKARAEMLNWYCQRIRQLYGPKTEKSIFDLATILSGMVREYMFYMIVEDKPIDLKRLAHYIIARLEDIVEGLKDNQEPLLDSTIMDNYIHIHDHQKKQASTHLLHILEQIETLSQEAELDSDKKEKACSSINALKEEIKENAENSKLVVVESLLFFLRHLDIPEADKYLDECSKIAKTHFNK
ncbi:TetR/AcrR family transcriptional regulator [Priestia abyssalis]|uniref:TetR/AcrR family transcriptional regulator n=1 Tax=Priestia abyssalis TaxID=1221450 RepID=UPI0009953A60|nr:TetR/AcrR family transcriptional regulator [Priestia abyssalis]